MSQVKQSKNKYIPLYVLAFAMGIILIGMFTPYEITEEHVTIMEFVLTPIGLGGLAKHGLDIAKQIKLKTIS